MGSRWSLYNFVASRSQVKNHCSLLVKKFPVDNLTKTVLVILKYFILAIYVIGLF